ncbi:Mariner Mos1 transposase [Eumeta japonica]|uniref:Mariner Mos1 transposase n=1 Tax=Eumeta variegata TaxID=151549 RepID=A0A4C1VUZ1_EUMVA|nr:Mariner Mos1 transposase [Eumeta japonica]
MIDYLLKGQTITGYYYADLLHKLQECIQEKRLNLAQTKSSFTKIMQRFTYALTQGKNQRITLGIFAPSTLSPDLGSSLFHLFPKLKPFLGGQKFVTNDDVIDAVDYFAGLEESHFMEGITALERRWTNCVELKGDYVEKLKPLRYVKLSQALIIPPS